jgi:glycosyltransferase involved in cell wall biosynthesis
MGNAESLRRERTSRTVISVIIATHSRRDLLARTLDALVSQDWAAGEFELIVVDNASTDGTADYVRDLARRLERPAVVLVQEVRSGKTHAVNAGLAAARGDLLVFTDDDVVPEPQWLRALDRALRETGADFAVGRITPLWEAPPPDWVGPALYGVLAIPDNGPSRLVLSAGLNEHVMALAGNLAVRPHVFAEIGPWRTDLGKEVGSLRSGEDHEFFLRMLRGGYRGVYEPEARVAHLVPAARLRRSYFRRWLYENGRMVAGLERQFPSTPRYLLGVPRYLWRQAAGDALAFVGGCRPGTGRSRFAAEARLLWFIGYLRGAWTTQRQTGARRGREIRLKPNPMKIG